MNALIIRWKFIYAYIILIGIVLHSNSVLAKVVEDNSESELSESGEIDEPRAEAQYHGYPQQGPVYPPQGPMYPGSNNSNSHHASPML